jgi:hypothetical protein
MTQRQRDKRVALALTRLRQVRRAATALEIGAAAIEGEPRAHHITRNGKESIGLAIAAALARHGLLRSTRDNCFILRERAHCRDSVMNPGLGSTES